MSNTEQTNMTSIKTSDDDFDRLHRALAHVTRHYAVLKANADGGDRDCYGDGGDDELTRRITLGEIVEHAVSLSPEKLDALWAVAGTLANEGRYLSCPAFSKLLDDERPKQESERGKRT
jgi:hypothetical protein